MSEPLRTEPVATKAIHVDNEGIPFSTKSSETSASIGFEDPYQEARNAFQKSIIGKAKAESRYKRTGPRHHRNMTEIIPSKKAVWGGKLSGDIYGERTIKGTNFADARLESLGPVSHQIRSFGLMDDSDLPRLIRASEFLRKNGLPTERPTKISKLDQVLVLNETDNAWNPMPVKKWEERELKRIKRDEPQTYESAKKYLKETNFVVLERDVQVDERLWDIIDAARNNKLREAVQPIFKWLKIATTMRNGGIISGTPKPKSFEYTDPDLKEYFVSYLPAQMGIYLGRFHKLGLVHGYLHGGNWSAIGTVLDCDSIYGPSIFTDDWVSTKNSVDGDILDTSWELTDMIEELKHATEFNGVDTGKAASEALYNFAYNYLTERYGSLTFEGITEFKHITQSLDPADGTIKMLDKKLIEENLPKTYQHDSRR